MIKKDDKDAIIEHLKNTLTKVKDDLAFYDRSKVLMNLYTVVENALNDVSF